MPTLTAPTLNDPALGEMVRRLVEIYKPQRIYLFGSAARGEAGPDSDYDFMVVVADDTPTEQRRSGRAHKALWRLGRAADVLVYRKTVFDEQLHLKASLPSTIVREGKLLYAE